MRFMFKLWVSLLLFALAPAPFWAQAPTIDPTSQIQWNLGTGTTLPNCTQNGQYSLFPYGAQWGQTFTLTTTSVTYTCSPTGWVAGAGASNPAVGAAGTIQASNGSGLNQAATGVNVTRTLQAGLTGGVQSFAVYGDSIGVGLDAFNSLSVDQTFGFANIILRKLGGLPQNFAQSSDSSRDEDAQHVYQTAWGPFAPGSQVLFFGNAGLTNDSQQWACVSGNQCNITLRALYASDEFKTVPNANKVPASQCTKTSGAWTADNTYASIANLATGATGESTASGGAVLTCASVQIGPQGDLVGAYGITDGNTNTFTLSVSAANQTDPIGGSTTWASSGDGGALISTTNGTTSMPAGFRLQNNAWANTSVNVVFTSTAAGTLDIQWLGSHPAISAANPPVFESNAPQYSTNGGCVATTNTVVSAQNALLAGVVSTIQTDGGNIALFDTYNDLGANPGTNNYFQPSQDCIHPSAAGHAKYAADMLNAALPVNVGSPTLASFQTVNYNGSQLSNYLFGKVTNRPNLFWSPNEADNFGDPTSWAPGINYLPTRRTIFQGAFTTMINNGVLTGLATVLNLNLPYYVCAAPATPTGDVILPSTVTCNVQLQGNFIKVGVASGGTFGSILTPTGNTFCFGLPAACSIIDYDPMILKPFVAATNVANQPSPAFQLQGNCWNSGSSASNPCTYNLAAIPGTGASPPTTLTASYTGQAGETANVDLTGWVQNGGTMKLPNLGTATANSITAPTVLVGQTIIGSPTNYVKNAATMTGAGWSVSGGLTATGGQVDPFTGTNAVQLTTVASGLYTNSGAAVTTGNTYLNCFWIKGALGTEQIITSVGNGASSATFTAPNAWTTTPNFCTTVVAGAATTITLNIALLTTSATVFIYGASVQLGTAYQGYLATGATPVTVGVPQVSTPLVNGGLFATGSNCSSSVSPAVCGSAAAGSVAMPTNAVSSSIQVNTTAVTANSQIFVTADDTLGTKLGVTCNSTVATLVGGLTISARTAGTSFTIANNAAIVTNPLCLSYLIFN